MLDAPQRLLFASQPKVCWHTRRRIGSGFHGDRVCIEARLRAMRPTAVFSSLCKSVAFSHGLISSGPHRRPIIHGSPILPDVPGDKAQIVVTPPRRPTETIGLGLSDAV